MYFEKLKEKFEFILESKLETEGNEKFLRIKVDMSSLESISKITREIVDYIYKIDEKAENYFIDIYSKGTEEKVAWEDIDSCINENVKVEFRRPIKNILLVEGTLLSIDGEKIIVRYDAKGQWRKIEIEKSDIESFFKSAKVKRSKK